MGMKKITSALFALSLLVFETAHACRSFNGSTDVARVDASAISARPATICARFRPTADDATIRTVVFIGDKDVNNQTQIRIRLAMNVAGDPLRASETADAGTLASADTSNGITLNAFSSGCVSFVSATSRQAILDNGTQASETTSLTTTFGSFDRMSIASADDSTPGEPYAGDACEVGVWNVELSAMEKRAFMNGINPDDIRPTALVAYWEMYGIHSPEIDKTRQKNHLTLTGTARSFHRRRTP